MALGPGKYDDLATIVRDQAGADGAVVMIIGGPEGGGFSVQAYPADMILLPTLLRLMADKIERDLRG